VAERNQDVVGSDGRCHVPNNHSKYRTSVVLAIGGTLVNDHRHRPGPGIQLPDAVAGETFDLRMLGGQERPHRGLRVLGLHTWQYHLPNRDLKLWRRGGDGQVSGLDHVNSIRQGSVEPDPDIIWIHRGCERDLQVLSFAGCAGWRAAVVGDLGMRGESG
jgi:hypothetical protein